MPIHRELIESWFIRTAKPGRRKSPSCPDSQIETLMNDLKHEVIVSGVVVEDVGKATPVEHSGNDLR